MYVYSETDKDPAPAWDKLILLRAQKTLALNLCKVEEGGRDGSENLYKYIIPWGTQCFHTSPSFPFKNNIHSWWKTAGLFQCVCWGRELCNEGQKGGWAIPLTLATACSLYLNSFFFLVYLICLLDSAYKQNHTIVFFVCMIYFIYSYTL